MKLTIEPLTPERWSDFETVFNARGCSVARGCWCMYYRLSGPRGPEVDGMKRAQAWHARFRAVVAEGPPPGLIAYRDGAPVGWVSLGPREDFARLGRSPVMKAVDEQPVWSIVCFVVPSQYRGQGVARGLLEGAIAYAAQCGARVLEAYPVDQSERSRDDAMWFGAKSMYDAAGFEEVARRKPHRPVVRRIL
uniref:GNAT family N-acetyltransferase n=2 Tax=Aromatoleum toluolicum TaxID=90060 RepID=A0ABX1NJV7_9RHOO|nr:GNAT family N-acetyltransferase [Aromatoleum toluolicum]